MDANEVVLCNFVHKTIVKLKKKSMVSTCDAAMSLPDIV